MATALYSNSAFTVANIFKHGFSWLLISRVSYVELTDRVITNGTDPRNILSLEILSDISLHYLFRYAIGVASTMMGECHIQQRHVAKWSRTKERKAG